MTDARGHAKPKAGAFVAALIVMAGLFQSTPAFAVHDEGIFELDGNIANDAVPGDDWGNLFPTNSSTTELDTFFVNDAADAGQNWFQGSSQDREKIADWNWGGNSGPQDKDNITNAYGASYISGAGDRLAYVGADRFANNGDSELGFWFFQDEVTLGPDGNPGGTFNGTHTPNDVLVLASWESNGGVKGIEVWVWDPTVKDNLRQIVPTPAAPTGTCPAPTTTLTEDRVCAIGNTSNLVAPWSYTPKFPPANSPANTMPPGSFFEAGVNLTQLVGNVCFTSLLAETRSSHSTETATLQDLVLSDFNTCPPPTISTTSSPTGVQARGTSTTASDTAKFSGTFGPVTGTADFFLCGPGQATAADSSTGCPTGGTQYGDDIAINDGAATSSTTPLLNAAGLYCWRVDYTPARGATYAEGSHTNNASECFTLRDKAPATISTTSSPTGEQARGLNTAASDTANFSGSLGEVTGTADFFLCGPDQNDAADSSAGCAAGGSQYGDDIALSNGSATSTTTATLSAPGLYCWRVEYSGDANYLPGSHTNSSSECFTLRDKAPATIETTSTPTGQQPRGTSTTASDSATFSGSLGDVTGTADFFLCGPGQANAADSGSGCAAGGTQYGNDRPISNGAATSTTTGNLSTAGLYCWRVEYSGDANYDAGSHTNNASECFILGDKGPATIVTTSSPSGDQARGASTTASDTANFSGSLGEVTGTADFFLCGPGQANAADASTGCASGGTQYGNDRPLSGGSATSTTTPTLSQAGLYCWRVEYSGDANYFAGSHTNNSSECFTLRDKAPATIATTSSPTGEQGAGDTTSASDTANFSGSLGEVTGTADFFLCGPGQGALASGTTGCPSGGTQYGSDVALSGGSATSSTTGNLSTPGLYCWRVEYSGDGNYLAGSHTNSGSECFTLVAAPPPPPRIDLSIVKTDDRDPINLGESVTYTLVATNNSSVNATGVVVSDQLPADVTFVSASSGCSHSSGVVTCNVGNLNGGASVTFTITVTPQRTGTITDVATVRGNEEESDTSNNRDTEDTTVQAVLGETITRPEPAPAPAPPAAPPAPAPAPPRVTGVTLPRTGSGIQSLTLIGMALVMIGLGLAPPRRRRKPAFGKR